MQVVAEGIGSAQADFDNAMATVDFPAALQQIFEVDFPSTAPSYFILSLRGQSNVEWVLNDRAKLRALFLPEYFYVAPEGNRNNSPQRALGLMPFQVTCCSFFVGMDMKCIDLISKCSLAT